MAGHEIPILDSGSDCDLADCGPFHGRYANTVTKAGVLFGQPKSVPVSQLIGKEGSSMKYLPWVLAIVGGWLIAAPFLLGYAGTEAAKINDVGIGVVMVLGALVWGFFGLRYHGLSTDMHAQRR